MSRLDDLVNKLEEPLTKIEKPATLIAGNTALAWSLQELSKYQAWLFDSRVNGGDVSLLETAVAIPVLVGATFALKEGWDYTGGLVKDAWDSAQAWYSKAAVAATTAAATGLAVLGTMKIVPHIVRSAEEALSFGAAAGAAYAANKYALIPLAEKVEDLIDTKPKKHKFFKNIGAALLTAGLCLTDNVQNLVRDVHNTGVAAYHSLQSQGKRPVTDYWLQYGLESPVDEEVTEKNKGNVTSTFGFRKKPGRSFSFFELPRGSDSEFHYALDVSVPVGTPIKAAEDGTVLQVSGRGLNRTITLDHDGLLTIYRHNSKINYKVGDEVKQGDIIALSGNAGTGPHLHFEVQAKDIFGEYRFVNPR